MRFTPNDQKCTRRGSSKKGAMACCVGEGGIPGRREGWWWKDWKFELVEDDEICSSEAKHFETSSGTCRGCGAVSTVYD